LEPGTLQVNAEMLFEKLNLTALLIGAVADGTAHRKKGWDAVNTSENINSCDIKKLYRR